MACEVTCPAGLTYSSLDSLELGHLPPPPPPGQGGLLFCYIGRPLHHRARQRSETTDNDTVNWRVTSPTITCAAAAAALLFKFIEPADRRRRLLRGVDLRVAGFRRQH